MFYCILIRGNEDKKPEASSIRNGRFFGSVGGHRQEPMTEEGKKTDEEVITNETDITQNIPIHRML